MFLIRKKSLKLLNIKNTVYLDFLAMYDSEDFLLNLKMKFSLFDILLETLDNVIKTKILKDIKSSDDK